MSRRRAYGVGLPQKEGGEQMSRDGGEAVEEHREGNVLERSNAVLQEAGYDPQTIRNPAGLPRSTHCRSGSFKTLWVLILTLPIMTCVLVVLFEIFGLVVRLFSL